MKNKFVNKVIIFFIIFVLIFYIICSFSKVSAYQQTIDLSSYYKDTEIGILAYKQISAFQVKLADGSIIADAAISTNSNLDVIENLKKVELVFVIDTSGSMSGTKEQTTRESTKTLVQALFERIGEDNLKIGIIYFNSGMDASNVLELTDNQSAIMTHLDKIYASGGTQMADSLQKAQSMLNTSTSTDDETIKIVCTLSDGALGDEVESIEEFKNINNAGISTISIFVETPVTSAFSDLASQNGEYHKNFQTSTADLATTIVKDIYNEIYLKIILMSEPKTEYNINHNGVLLGSDKIIFQMDEEILHGATLKVEYIISITTAFDMNNVKINDFYSSDFVFNSNEPLLTELKTNNDYGWKIENGTLVSNSGDGTIEGATEYRIKLVLSTLLTPERLPDLNKMGNYMTFSVHDITDNRVISVDETANIKALDFLILPPTGEDNLSTEDLLGLLRLSIFTLATIIVIICINNYIKEHRYR